MKIVKPVLTKDRLELMCARAGLRPEIRTHFKHYDVLIADGFTSLPERDLQKFGVTAEEFPLGAFAALWLVAKDDRIDGGGVLTEKPAKGAGEEAKRERIRAAMLAAGNFILRREKHRGIKLNA